MLCPIPDASLEWFKAWTGLGGFAGVILTLIATSLATRRTERNQKQDENESEQASVATIRQAILSAAGLER